MLFWIAFFGRALEQFSRLGDRKAKKTGFFCLSQLDMNIQWPARIFFYDALPRSGSRNKISKPTLLSQVTKLIDEDFHTNLVFDDWYGEEMEEFLHSDQIMHPERIKTLKPRLNNNSDLIKNGN